jgi:hypothetical protein
LLIGHHVLLTFLELRTISHGHHLDVLSFVILQRLHTFFDLFVVRLDSWKVPNDHAQDNEAVSYVCVVGLF